MDIKNTVNNLDVPNVSDLIKSAQSVKNSANSTVSNKVTVHFLYADGRFKQTVIGVKSHISGVPVVYIETPNLLAYIILEESLIYDITSNSFELFVNEQYSHSIRFIDLKPLNITDKLKKIVEKMTFLTPVCVDMFKYHSFNIPMYNPDTNKFDDVEIMPSHLSSLGRAKMLEQTTSKNNDGLILIGILCTFVGITIGIVGTLIVTLG